MGCPFPSLHHAHPDNEPLSRVSLREFLFLAPTLLTRKMAQQRPAERAPDYDSIGRVFPLHLAALQGKRRVLHLLVSAELLQVSGMSTSQGTVNLPATQLGEQLNSLLAQSMCVELN